MTLVVAVVLAVALLAAYASWLAGRVDRLRLRVEATRASLDLQLTRRAAVCRDVDRDGPVAVAAVAALVAVDHEREVAESALSRAVRQAWADPWPDELRARVSEATDRVQLARQFHNAAVTALQRLRRRPLVRLLHVAGAPPEGYVEIDDTLHPR